jgi:hypothetical protein
MPDSGRYSGPDILGNFSSFSGCLTPRSLRFRRRPFLPAAARMEPESGSRVMSG